MARVFELHISIADLERMTVGFVMDMLTERLNDDYKYPRLAEQADIDKFLG